MMGAARNLSFWAAHALRKATPVGHLIKTTTKQMQHRIWHLRHRGVARRAELVEPFLNTSCFDAIVVFCNRFYNLGLVWWMLEQQISMVDRVLEVINFNAYAITDRRHDIKRSASTSCLKKLEFQKHALTHSWSDTQNCFNTYYFDSCPFYWNNLPQRLDLFPLSSIHMPQSVYHNGL